MSLVATMRQKCAEALALRQDATVPPGSVPRSSGTTGWLSKELRRTAKAHYCRTCGHSFSLSAVDQDAFCCGRPALVDELPAAPQEMVAPSRSTGSTQAAEDWIFV
jgi:hypothetical protein